MMNGTINAGDTKMQVDRARLIELVQEHPVLWNQKLKNYHDRIVKSKSWEEIALELQTTGEDAKKKWECLRDQFRRELKRIPLSDRTALEDVKPHWPYFKNMLFLKDMVVPHNIKRELTDEHSYEEMLLEDILTPKIEISWAEQNSHEKIPAVTEEFTTSSNVRNPRKRHYIERKSDFRIEKKILKLIEERLDVKQNETNNHDDDYHFVMSILPSLRQIKTNRKLKFRARLLDMISEELHCYELSPSASSSTAISSFSMSSAL